MKTRKNGRMTIMMTGAHITPAVAVTQALRDRQPNVRVVYLGRSSASAGNPSVERDEIERVGGEFMSISFGKLHRYLSISQLAELSKIPAGLAQVGAVLLKERPSVVVSFGGYLSVPVVLWAKVLGIPFVVHEQTGVWGLANRLAKRWAAAVAVSWPELVSPGVHLTGNPIPKEILEVGNMKGQKRDVLYLTLGNQGSQAISRAIEPILPELVKHFVVYHQTRGPVVNLPNYHTAPWFPTPRHAEILSRTFLAVSRAGANTITYHAYLGIPSLLVPLPYSGSGEQVRNAQLFHETGLAEVMPQASLTPESLLDAILSLKERCHEMRRSCAHKAKRLVRPDAAMAVADIVLQQI